MSKDITVQESGELTNDPPADKALQLGERTPGIDINAALARILRCFDTAGIIRTVKTGVQYVVQVPAEFQKGLADGTFSVMESAKSGKQWATLVQKLPGGKNEIVCNMPIKPESVMQGNPMHDMSVNMQMMALQQQIASLTELVQEVCDTVKRIEQGQTDDRIGLLLAGKQGIEQAMLIQDEFLRKEKLANAQQTLLEARGQIAVTLQRKISEFPKVPERPVQRFFMELKKSGSLAQCDDAFDAIQTYYQLYLAATRLLADSYLYCGERAAAENAYAGGIAFLRDLDFARVRTLRYTHPEDDFSDSLCERAVEYMESERTLSLETARPYDTIELTVTGEQIVQALGGADGETV